MDQYDIDKDIPRLGPRAEILSAYYLRFNGFFPLPNFILHDAGKFKQPGNQLTEVDLLAVRLPYAKEVIKGEQGDIMVKTHDKLDVRHGIMDFVIAEVSSQVCKFNWIIEENGKKSVNVESLKYVLRRFGWWHDEKINHISNCLSEDRQYYEKPKGTKDAFPVRVRLLSFGVITNPELPIVQLTIAEMLRYMKCDLFGCYGCNEKFRRIVSDHKQWDKLIQEVYGRLLGHKKPLEQTPEEVIEWLFPGPNHQNKL